MLWGAGFVRLIASIHGRVWNLPSSLEMSAFSDDVRDGMSRVVMGGRGCAREDWVRVGGTGLFEEGC